MKYGLLSMVAVMVWANLSWAQMPLWPQPGYTYYGPLQPVYYPLPEAAGARPPLNYHRPQPNLAQEPQVKVIDSDPPHLRLTGRLKAKRETADLVPGTPLGHSDGACRDYSSCPPPPPDCPHSSPPGRRFYGKAEYLYWWARNQEAPTLLTFGPLAQPTQSVIGDGDLQFDNQERQGGRVTAGVWLTRCQTLALEGTFFYLGQRTPEFAIQSDGTTAIQRPFFNTNTGVADAAIIAAAGQPGSAQVSTLSQILGGEVNFRWEFLRRRFWHIDWLAGFRYFHLQEDLNVQTATTVAGVPISVNDLFATDNNFFGGQLGLDYEVHCGPVFFNVWGKFAIGDNAQHASIRGSTTTAGVTTNGGLLALPSNIGEYRRDRLTILPETGASFGFRLCDQVRVSVGYSVLFLNNSLRPGSSIDSNINPTQVGAPGPTFRFQDHTFWVQGVNGAIEFRY